jgi:hypothetical protein
MEALARVGVFEQVGAVELRQAMGIGGEVRRHPIEDHADAGLVQRVDEGLEVVRRAVARARCEIPGGLVAPRAVERMLHERQQFNVGETHAHCVLSQLLRRLTVAEPVAVFAAAPRSQVHLVDSHRGVQRIAHRPLAHPGVVVPDVVIAAPHHRPGRRRQLGAACERVGLVEQRAVTRADAELVALALLHRRHPHLPDAGAIPAWPGRVRIAAPIVELAHHRHGCGIGRPHGEARALRPELATQLAIQLRVRAFAEQMNVVLAETVGRGPGGIHRRLSLPDRALP